MDEMENPLKLNDEFILSSIPFPSACAALPVVRGPGAVQELHSGGGEGEDPAEAGHGRAAQRHHRGRAGAPAQQAAQQVRNVQYARIFCNMHMYWVLLYGSHVVSRMLQAN